MGIGHGLIRSSATASPSPVAAATPIGQRGRLAPMRAVCHHRAGIEERTIERRRRCAGPCSASACPGGLVAAAVRQRARAAGPAARRPATTRRRKIVPDIEKRLAQFAPTPLEADLSALSPEDRQVLDLLVEAARLMNEIFLRQAWAGNPALREELAGWQGRARPRPPASTSSINFGPWDRLDESQALPRRQPASGGRRLLPRGPDQGGVRGAGSPPTRATASASPPSFTVIRRQRRRTWWPCPTPRSTGTWLEPAAAKLLREAAAATDERLAQAASSTLRADAFLDRRLLRERHRLDGPRRPGRGHHRPLRDLRGRPLRLQGRVRGLRHRQPAQGVGGPRPLQGAPPLAGAQPADPRRAQEPRTAAPRARSGWSTPSTPRATPGPACRRSPSTCPTTSGCARPRARRRCCCATPCAPSTTRSWCPSPSACSPRSRSGDVSFDAYFDEVLHHELSHGLGPGTITVDGRKTEVRLELKELYSTLEEAKADVMGVYNILALIEPRRDAGRPAAARSSRPTSPASSAPPASASTRRTARASWRSSTT